MATQQIRGGQILAGAFTPGAVLFAGASDALAQDPAHLFWNTSTKSLLVNGASDGNPLEVVGNFTGVSGVHVIGTFTAYGDFCRYVLRRANGTAGSPTAVLAADVTGSINFRGYGSTAFGLNVAQIRAVAAETYTDAAQGTHVEIVTTPLGSATNAVAVRVSSEGNVGIGTTAFPTTGTGVLVLIDLTEPSGMGANTAGFYAHDVAGTVNLFAINEAGTVTQLSGRTAAYTLTNVTTDRSYNANATTLDEVADVLGTLIADLQARGDLWLKNSC